MGQAAIDLPDAIESSAPAPLKSADDLLAQMAGQEIDRMLADDDSQIQRTDGPQPATQTPSEQDRILPTTEAELDELLRTAEREAAEVAAGVAALAPPASAPAVNKPGPVAPLETYAAQVDALFKELNVETPLSPPAAPPSASAPVDQQTTPVELAALTAPISAEQTPEPLAAAEQKPSLLVGLLELINAPFAACPDMLRDALGKIAILTLMNSLGLLLYLILFRR